MWTTLLSLSLLPAQDLTIEENYELLQSVERVTPVVRVVEAVTPAVVYVETEYTQRGSNLWGPFERTFAGSGSGVVVHADGYIVTNYHVVRGARTIWVTFDRDPVRHPAQLVSFVPKEDLALLKITDPGPYPVVRLGTSSDLWPGERVVAIGNPQGQTHTVSSGIISGLHRDVQIGEPRLEFSDLIQTDASINQGNSGGPLLNIRGELIGINTAMNTRAENIGFAIPVDRVRDVLTDILFPQARKSWLGFELAEGGPLVVERVWADSPAALAGICEGDRILALGDQTVNTATEFLDATLVLQPKQRVPVLFQRGDERKRATIETWDKVDGLLFERLGVTMTEAFIEHGSWLLVDRVRSDGPGASLGLASGDLIPAIRPRTGRPRTWRIDNRRTLAEILGLLEPGVEIEIDVYRDDNGDRAFNFEEEHYKGLLKIQ